LQWVKVQEFTLKQRGGNLSTPDIEGGSLLFLIDEMTSITAGGTERQLIQMIQIARTCGWTPQVCVMRKSEWFSEEIAGCPVKRLDWENIASIRSLGSCLRAVRWMHQQKFDAMQTIFPESNLVGPWLAKLAGIPVVLGTRRNLSPGIASCFHWPALFRRLTNYLTAGILVNSEAVLRRTHSIERAPFRKLFVIHNGIDIQKISPSAELRAQMRGELGLGEDDLLVGNLSGLRPIKGIDTFIDAAVLARKNSERLRFVVVGEGELRAEAEAIIERKGLRGICTVAGPAVDVLPYLAAMDIAVLCSRAEGFSNSLLEYMAAGLAIVATDVGGNREALGGSGLLIAPDDPAALARAIVSLRESRHREVLGKAAKHAVQRFDLPIAEAKTASIYRKLLTPRVTKRNRYLVEHARPGSQPLFLTNSSDLSRISNFKIIDHKESR
jgi:glycosyltransferase involved in cell wall biosynthesis